MILLVVPSLDLWKFKGLARVSLEFYKRLRNFIEVEVYEVHKRKKSYISNLTKVPFKQLTTKAKIIHSIVPESGSFLFLIKHLKNIKTIVTFHDVIPLRYLNRESFNRRFLLKTYFFKIMWKLASYSEIVVAQSSQTAEEVKKFFRREVNKVIPFGVDEKFKQKKMKRDKITIGFLGSWIYRKRVDIVINVFKRLKMEFDCKLILAGGKLETKHQKQFNVYRMTKNLEDVVIISRIPEERIVDFYNSLDFFIFPSEYEGFGLPVLEAQKCGVPVFIMKDSRIPFEVSRAAIKCKNVSEMVEKIKYFINNRREYKKISRKGIRYSSKFTWKRTIDSYLKLYGR